MFGMSGGELVIIAVVALVAIGPKDLPKALRMAGKAVSQVRRMAGDFQAQFNEAIREADLEELRKNASDIKDAVAPFQSGFDPMKSANEQLMKAIGEPALPAPVVVEPAEPVVKTAEPPSEAATPAKAKTVRKTAKAKEPVVASKAETPSRSAKSAAKDQVAAVEAKPSRTRKPRKPDEKA